MFYSQKNKVRSSDINEQTLVIKLTRPESSLQQRKRQITRALRKSKRAILNAKVPHQPLISFTSPPQPPGITNNTPVNNHRHPRQSGRQCTLTGITGTTLASWTRSRWSDPVMHLFLGSPGPVGADFSHTGTDGQTLALQGTSGSGYSDRTPAPIIVDVMISAALAELGTHWHGQQGNSSQQHASPCPRALPKQFAILGWANESSITATPLLPAIRLSSWAQNILQDI